MNAWRKMIAAAIEAMAPAAGNFVLFENKDF
jgi:hypothetical protein